MLGDVQIAEPGALIGFAGQRVIEQTIREKLPEGFQRAEYLLDHGMIDMVVPRSELHGTLGTADRLSGAGGRRRRPDGRLRALGTIRRVQAQLDRLATHLSPAATASGSTASRALLDRLGRPQDRLPPVFHVAGTNGKGSTCAFLRAALEAAGRHGPRLHQPASGPLQRAHPRRRQADRGRAARRVCWPRCSTRATASTPASSKSTTAVAFLAFARTPGRRLRSSRSGSAAGSTRPMSSSARWSAASPRSASTISSSSASSLAEIAAEKAGIAKRGVPLVVALLSRRKRRKPSRGVAPRAGRAAASRRPRLDRRPDLALIASRRPSGSQRQPRLADAPRAGSVAGRPSVHSCSGLTSATGPPASRTRRWPARPPTRNLAGRRAQSRSGDARSRRFSRTHGPMHIVLGILANKDADAIVDVLAAARTVADLRAGHPTTLTIQQNWRNGFDSARCTPRSKEALGHTCPRRG